MSTIHERARERVLDRLAGGGTAHTASPRGGALLDDLEHHLAECSACREYAEQVERGLAAFRAVPVAAGVDLASRTRARLRGEMTSPVDAAMPLGVLVSAGAVTCGGLLAWILLAHRFGAWCAAALDLSTATALIFSSIAWLLPSALAAVALIVAGARASEEAAGWHAFAMEAEVNDGTA